MGHPSTHVYIYIYIILCACLGEFPVADFTPLGKFVAGIIGCFAVGVFAIPAGIFGAGFEDYVLTEKERCEAAKNSGAMCIACGKELFADGMHSCVCLSVLKKKTQSTLFLCVRSLCISFYKFKVIAV